MLDEEVWYSVTPKVIATQMAERRRCDGGNAIALARTCQHGTSPVRAKGFSKLFSPASHCARYIPTRLALARQNAALHGRVLYAIGLVVDAFFAAQSLLLKDVRSSICFYFIRQAFSPATLIFAGTSVCILNNMGWVILTRRVFLSAQIEFVLADFCTNTASQVLRATSESESESVADWA
jgi:hypothetical protein